MIDDAAKKALAIARQVEPEEAARLKRAKKMNFDDQTFYHGANGDFNKFLTNHPWATATGEPAAFFSDNPAVAGSYLAGQYVKSNTEDAPEYNPVPMGENISRYYSQGTNVMPVKIRDMHKFDVWDMGGGRHNPNWMSKTLREARRNRVPGVIFENMRDPGMMTASQNPEGNPGVPSKIVAVFKPNLIRSQFANFDPTQKTDPDITKASGGMIDDPAKAIRRAVLVAKGLSRTIGPMPGKDEGERHGYKTDGAVTGSGGMQGYKDVPFQHIEERSPGWEAAWTPLHEVGSKLGNPTKISESAANYGDFMNMMAHKASSQGLSPRDLVKSYLMTVSSQGRSAVAPHTILKNWPEYPGPTHQNIRPEGAMGEWLNSPMGKRYLDNAEQGKIDQGAIDHVLNAFQGFGKINTAEGAALPWAVHSLVPHTKIVSDMIADSVKGRHSAEDWRNWVKQNIKNVAFAKSGFWASMLGRGDQAVPDARQMLLNTPNSNADAIKLIGTGNSDPAILREGEAMRRIMDRQRALNLAVPKELEPHYHALAHHTIWDAAEGTDTTHQDVINAMRHAASGGAINENDRTHPVAMIFKAMGMPGLDGHHDNIDRALSVVRHYTPHRR